MQFALACVIFSTTFIMAMDGLHAAEASPKMRQGRVRDAQVIVSPLYGWNRNKMTVRGHMGQVSTETDTAPEYGFFFLIIHGRLVFTDYAFMTDVNDTDVSGNVAFLNVYGDHKARVSWNVGAGHLYHKIEPSNEDITVNVPMVKAGPLINIPSCHLRINPYVGYAWEHVETQRVDIRNDSFIYGVTVGWHWRMLGATAKYYYQDSRDASEDYQTVRARAHAMFNEHFGIIVRFDYMEHMTSDDTSMLFGPVALF